MAISYGRKIEFGVQDPLPLHGFPPGRARIRQRYDAFTVVYIRPPDGGVRRFSVEERDGVWCPAFETGANRNASNASGLRTGGPPRDDSTQDRVVGPDSGPSDGAKK